jgi:hypothetical protein
MPFDSGPLTLTVAHLPRPLPEDALQRFADKAAAPLTGLLDTPQIGWVSGRHLLETRIDDETAFAGGHLHLHLRTAQRKIPVSLLRAECRMEELAHMRANETPYLSRKDRGEIKQSIIDRLLPDMPPTITGLPFVVDARHQRLYIGAAAPKVVDGFLAFFYEAFKFEPTVFDADAAVEILLGVHPDSLPILQFSEEAITSDIEATLGRDFLTWLWYYQECHGGEFSVGEFGRFAVMIDGPLAFAGDGQSALESVVRKGTPTRSAEAKASMTVGKKLRSAKVTLVRDEEAWVFTLDGDRFAFRGLTLPAGEALDPHSKFQERIMFLHIFFEALTELLRLYTSAIGSDAALATTVPSLRRWVKEMESKGEVDDRSMVASLPNSILWRTIKAIISG